MANEVGLGRTVTWPSINQDLGNALLQLADALRKLHDINTNYVEPRSGSTGLQLLTVDGTPNGTLVSSDQANAFLGPLFAGANLYKVFNGQMTVGNNTLTDATGYDFYSGIKLALGTGA